MNEKRIDLSFNMRINLKRVWGEGAGHIGEERVGVGRGHDGKGCGGGTWWKGEGAWGSIVGVCVGKQVSRETSE